MSHLQGNNDTLSEFLLVLDAHLWIYLNNLMSVFICMWIPPQLWAQIYELDVQSLHSLVDLFSKPNYCYKVPPVDQDRIIRNSLLTELQNKMRHMVEGTNQKLLYTTHQGTSSSILSFCHSSSHSNDCWSNQWHGEWNTTTDLRHGWPFRQNWTFVNLWDVHFKHYWLLINMHLMTKLHPHWWVYMKE